MVFLPKPQSPSMPPECWHATTRYLEPDFFESQTLCESIDSIYSYIVVEFFLPYFYSVYSLNHIHDLSLLFFSTWESPPKNKSICGKFFVLVSALLKTEAPATHSEEQKFCFRCAFSAQMSIKDSWVIPFNSQCISICLYLVSALCLFYKRDIIYLHVLSHLYRRRIASCWWVSWRMLWQHCLCPTHLSTA